MDGGRSTPLRDVRETPGQRADCECPGESAALVEVCKTPGRWLFGAWWSWGESNRHPFVSVDLVSACDARSEAVFEYPLLTGSDRW